MFFSTPRPNRYGGGQEVSFAESQRQRAAYLTLFRSLPRTLVVNADSPVTEVAHNVTTAINELSAKFLPEARAFPLSISALAEQIFSSLPPAPYGGAPLRLLAVHGHGAPRWLIPEAGSASGALWPAGRRIGSPRECGRRPFGPPIAWNSRSICPTSKASSSKAVMRLTGARSAGGTRNRLLSVCTSALRRNVEVHLALVDRFSGSCEAIMKAPIAPRARNAILSEADTLRRLAKEQLVGVPFILSLDHERGISTQQFVSGRPGSRRLRPSILSSFAL